MRSPTYSRLQRGAALYVVLVVVLLSMLAVLWASRSARFHAISTGNEADHQRALQAAGAMLRDGEFDIRGIRPDGAPCASTASATCRGLSVSDGQGQAHYPVAGEPELNTALMDALEASAYGCIAGVCSPRNLPRTDFWADETVLSRMKGVAAHYGEFTGATATRQGNPLLFHDARTAPRAWYWVEILPYNVAATAGNSGSGSELWPDRDSPYVYRITGIAEGLKPGTRAVVQALLVLRKVDS